MTLTAAAQQLLVQARDLFANTHWTKGEFLSEEQQGTELKPTYCAVGALRYLAGEDPLDANWDELALIEGYREALVALADRIDQAKTVGILTDAGAGFVEAEDIFWADAVEYLEDLIIYWNDSATTELSDVLSKFDAALTY